MTRRTPTHPTAAWPTFEGRPLVDPTEPVVDRGLRFDDNVFGQDGGAQQLGSVEGSIEGGLTVSLTVPVASA